MRNIKRALALLLTAMLLAACTPKNSSQIQDEPEQVQTPVNLIYYTIGTPDADLSLINEQLNELLLKKIGITVDYIKIGWNDYETQLDSLINSGRQFDIAFAVNYAQQAQKGAWLALDEYLLTIGSEMYQAIDPLFWEGAAIGGKVYGVPTNKELAVLEQWMYPKELVEKYNIDITQYTTLESLEPLFAAMQQNEPEWLMFELDKDSHNFFAMFGYEYISNKYLPLMVKSLSEESIVVNPFDTEEGRSVLDTLRGYYLDGYINEDAAVNTLSGLIPDRKVFLRIAGGGPYSDTIWSQQRGYDVVAHAVTEPIVTSESTQGGMMCVSASTRYPEACVAFLNLINTDVEVRNLLNFGIEGVHYDLDSNGQVLLNDGRGYSGVQYTQGNWFILYTQGGSQPEPLDKWKQYQEYNASAVKSNLLGFTPELSQFDALIADINIAWQNYYPVLMTGSVDVDTYLPAFLQALEDAGLEIIREELQRQLDSWLDEKSNGE